MFWNRPKVEFLCVDKTLEHLYPVIEARKLHPTWFKNETTAYANSLLKTKEIDQGISIVKCRGIRKLFNTGWIARTWQDIKIKVHEDGGFEWASPIDQKVFGGRRSAELVNFHDTDTFSNCPTLNKKVPILKIQLPWVIKIPKGYDIMQLPISYGDEDRFIGATGIFEPAFGSIMEINVQLLWQAGAGEFLIKAGTPLAQFIAMPSQTLGMVTRTITDRELDVLVAEQNVKNSTYCKHYQITKEHLKRIIEGR